jgi:hypothetical protein
MLNDFKEYDWKEYFERTKLLQWFETWKNWIIESREESIRKTEQLLTV